MDRQYNAHHTKIVTDRYNYTQLASMIHVEWYGQNKIMHTTHITPKTVTDR